MIKVKAHGHYTLCVNNKVVAEFDNLVTDAGMRALLQDNFFNRCDVGTGTTEPTPQDTTLVNLLAHTNTQGSLRMGFGEYGNRISTATTVTLQIERQYQFNVGQVVGNVSEVGIRIENGGLFSRALVRDSNGNPTSVTVMEDEQLIVGYVFRLTYPQIDTPVSLSLGNDELITGRLYFPRLAVGTQGGAFRGTRNTFTRHTGIRPIHRTLRYNPGNGSSSTGAGAYTLARFNTFLTSTDDRNYSRYAGDLISAQHVFSDSSIAPYSVLPSPPAGAMVIRAGIILHPARANNADIHAVCFGFFMGTNVGFRPPRPMPRKLFCVFDEPLRKTDDEEIRLMFDMTIRWRDPD